MIEHNFQNCQSYLYTLLQLFSWRLCYINLYVCLTCFSQLCCFLFLHVFIILTAWSQVLLIQLCQFFETILFFNTKIKGNILIKWHNQRLSTSKEWINNWNTSGSLGKTYVLSRENGTCSINSYRLIFFSFNNKSGINVHVIKSKVLKVFSTEEGKEGGITLIYDTFTVVNN